MDGEIMQNENNGMFISGYRISNTTHVEQYKRCEIKILYVGSS